MGNYPAAVLAYGINLGTMEDFQAAERDKYGFPELPWFDLADDFAEVAMGVLAQAHARTVAVPLYGWPTTEVDEDDYVKRAYGVEFERSGERDTTTGYVLAATGSAIRCEWTDVLAVDTATLDRAARSGWDDGLRRAVHALGIRPTQTAPSWLVFPYYG